MVVREAQKHTADNENHASKGNRRLSVVIARKSLSGVGWGEPKAKPNAAMHIRCTDVGVRLRLTPTYLAKSAVIPA